MIMSFTLYPSREYFNNNWKTDLHSRNTPERNVDALQNPNDNQWGSNSNLFFINLVINTAVCILNFNGKIG